MTEDFFTGEKNETAEALIHLFGLREDQLRMQEQQEQEPQSTKTTARGYPVLKIEKDGSDRNIAIVHRQTDTLDDYIVAIGYDVEDGRWAQGRYDFRPPKPHRSTSMKRMEKNNLPAKKISVRW